MFKNFIAILILIFTGFLFWINLEYVLHVLYGLLAAIFLVAIIGLVLGFFCSIAWAIVHLFSKVMNMMLRSLESPKTYIV